MLFTTKQRKKNKFINKSTSTIDLYPFSVTVNFTLSTYCALKFSGISIMCITSKQINIAK